MNDELYHYGVKGMRWGVRKDKSSDGMSRRQTRKAIRSQIRNIRKAQRTRYATTDITGMSDNELRNLNNRIQMENTYKSGMQPKLALGKKLLDALLNSSGSIVQTTVTAAGLSVASVVGVKAVHELFDKKHPVAAKNVADLYEKRMKPKKG